MAKVKEKILIIGAGGHAKVVMDAIRELDTFEIYGIADTVLEKGASVSGVSVIGNDGALPEIFERGIKCAFIGIGSIGDSSARKKIYRTLKGIGFRLPVIVHPRAFVAKSVKLGEGSFVAAGAVINPDAKIGKNAIINTSSSVDHDCVIGDFVHVAPKACLCGGVKVGDEAHIGTGANVIQYITIGKQAFVEAGSRVEKDLADKKRHFSYQGHSIPHKNYEAE